MQIVIPCTVGTDTKNLKPCFCDACVLSQDYSGVKEITARKYFGKHMKGNDLEEVLKSVAVS